MTDCSVPEPHNAHQWRDGPDDYEWCSGHGDDDPLTDEDEAVLDGHEAQDRLHDLGACS